MFTPVASAKKRLRAAPPDTPSSAFAASASAASSSAAAFSLAPAPISAAASPARTSTVPANATPIAARMRAGAAESAGAGGAGGAAGAVGGVLERGDHHTVAQAATWPERIRNEIGADGKDRGVEEGRAPHGPVLIRIRSSEYGRGGGRVGTVQLDAATGVALLIRGTTCYQWFYLRVRGSPHECPHRWRR